MRRLKIGERWIGPDAPVYVVAEAGSNHNGDLVRAQRLIDVAVEAGADAVKFQTFTAKTMYPRTAGESDYLRVPTSIYEIIRAMEMPPAWIPALARYCADRRIEFISTPFDEAAADLLAPHVNAFKIASYEMTHIPLVRHVARFGKPILMSTGTATLGEVVRTVDIIRAEGNDELVVLQCTASYPTPPDAVNARSIVTLREATGALVGLSDHSRDPVIAPTLAVALGACVIEKHFTLSNDLPGPDHKFAVEPMELAALVRAVRTAEIMLGHGRKEVLAAEEELRAFARRSIFTTRRVKAGERLDGSMIAVLRCGKLGYGLDPARYPELLGRVARRAIPAETCVRLEDIE